MAIRAIETRYKGYRFRSRQEARWAVCLDTLEIPWRYEYEGFSLNGNGYLPDFFLPDRQTWVEVKGKPPTPQEFIDATLLAQQSRQMVVITWENFDQMTSRDNVVFWYDEDGVFNSLAGWRWLENPEAGWEAARAARFDGKRKGLPWCDWGDVEHGELPY